MGVLIAVMVIWFASERCFTPTERRRRRRATWLAHGLITAKTVRDLWRIDASVKY